MRERDQSQDVLFILVSYTLLKSLTSSLRFPDWTVSDDDPRPTATARFLLLDPTPHSHCWGSSQGRAPVIRSHHWLSTHRDLWKERDDESPSGIGSMN